jgi:glycosyltransferase involved in cell wall biosynthesis
MDRPLRISLITGVLVHNDAISNSTADKARAVAEYMRAMGAPLELKTYAYTCALPIEGDFKAVSGVNEIIFDWHFRASDIAIYDFGIYYELFNTIFLAPAGCKRVVHYHNITPPDLVPEHMRDTILKSRDQLANAVMADRVIAGSIYNKQGIMKELGMEEEDVSVLDYVVNLPPASRTNTSRTEPVRLLYVGRFVASKGVLDLLKAVKQVVEGGWRDLSLDLVGNLDFSDTEYVAALREYIAGNGLDRYVNFVGSTSCEERNRYYEDADAFVMPSYHEGFCVPVIEAFNFGCYVIAYDAGNLPNTVNGLGSVIRTGDIGALAESIGRFCRGKRSGSMPVMLATASGEMPESDYVRQVISYAQGFSFESFRERLADILNIKDHIERIARRP